MMQACLSALKEYTSNGSVKRICDKLPNFILEQYEQHLTKKTRTIKNINVEPKPSIFKLTESNLLEYLKM